MKRTVKGNVLQLAKDLVKEIRTAEKPNGLFLVSVTSKEDNMYDVQFAKEDLRFKSVDRSHGKVYAAASRLMLLSTARYPGIVGINCTVNDEVPTQVFQDKKVLRICDLDA